jgi:hypothetical protein
MEENIVSPGDFVEYRSGVSDEPRIGVVVTVNGDGTIRVVPCDSPVTTGLWVVLDTAEVPR